MPGAENARTHFPIPIGELLDRLAMHRFEVTLDTFNRVFVTLEACFPRGLQSGTEGIDAAELQRLLLTLRPLVVRNPDEQLRFDTVFSGFFQEWNLPVQTNLAEPGEERDETTSDRPSKTRYAVIIGILLVLGVLTWRAFRPKEPTLRIQWQDITWQEKKFSAYGLVLKERDTAVWEIDSAAKILYKTGDSTLTYSFVPGKYHVKFDLKKYGSNSPISRDTILAIQPPPTIITKSSQITFYPYPISVPFSVPH